MKKIFKIKNIIFLLYIIFNIIIMLKHERWRDSARAWLLAKNFSLKDIFIISKYDGNPILWHIILMPFAKLGFPYILAQIITLFISLIAAYIFFYKIEIDDKYKTILLFYAPFIYVYSIIGRSYCLVFLIIILLGYIYNKRYSHPYLYTIILCLLLNTVTVAWGFAIALYVFFNLYEIIKLFVRKNKLSLKQILITNFLFIISLICVIIEISNTTNPDFGKPFKLFINNYSFVYLLSVGIVIFGIFILVFCKKMFKEYFICTIAIVAQIIIFLFFYSSILLPRMFYQTLIWMFLIIVLCTNDNKNKIYLKIVFLIFCFPFTISAYKELYKDYKYNFSSSKETAYWINNNISDDDILVDKSIMCQAVIPYLNNKKIYDIYYEKDFNNLKIYSFNQEKKDIDFSKYKNKYIIVSTYIDVDKYDKYLELKYKSHDSISGEIYSVYLIK